MQRAPALVPPPDSDAPPDADDLASDGDACDPDPSSASGAAAEEATTSDPTSTDSCLGLALGGGGMKGLAHVGVLSVLEEHDVAIDLVSGCSVGAVVGAFLAKGYAAEEMATILREKSILSLFTSPRLDGHGLLSADPLRQFLTRHLGDCTFDDLQVPFAVTCTDLEAGVGVVVDEGPVVEAVLASSAIPGVFAPVELDGRPLVDGGLSNNLPVSVLRERAATFTIGVRLFWQSVAWERTTDVDFDLAEEATSERYPALVRTLEQTAGWLVERLPRGLADVQRSLDLVIQEHEDQRLEHYPPDLLLTPEVTHIGILQFHENESLLYERGQEAAHLYDDVLRHLSTGAVEAARQAAGEVDQEEGKMASETADGAT
jgi:NTE family protein